MNTSNGPRSVTKSFHSGNPMNSYCLVSCFHTVREKINLHSKSRTKGGGRGLDRSMDSTSRPLRRGDSALFSRGLGFGSYNLPQRSQKVPLSISKLAMDKNNAMDPCCDFSYSESSTWVSLLRRGSDYKFVTWVSFLIDFKKLVPPWLVNKIVKIDKVILSLPWVDPGDPARGNITFRELFLRPHS